MRKLENLKKVISGKIEKERRSALRSIKKAINTEAEDLWSFYRYLPGQKKANRFSVYTKLTTKQQKLDYMKKRINIHFDKQLDAELSELIISSVEIEKIAINVIWKKNSTWGNNPTAEVRLWGKDHSITEGYNRVYIESTGKASGCGYDKESAAIASALNELEPLKALLIQEKDKRNNFKKTNHRVFGYGSGYGLIPTFESGVGVSCYPSILEKIGLTWKNVACGKTFDTYTIEKNSRER